MGSGAITFDIVERINEYWGSSYEGYGGNSANKITDSSWTCDILWNDIAEGVGNKIKVAQTDANSVTFTTAGLGDLRGNAVVAVRNSSGTILWTWHIWITDYNPDAIAAANSTVTTATNSKYTATGVEGELHRYSSTMWTSGVLVGKFIMDRNIGARDTDYAWSSNGGKGSLYYQFGRKDPFPAGSSTDGTASGTTSAAWLGTGSSTWDITDSPYKTAYASGGNTTAMAVNNPMAFYYRTSSAYGNNWCSEAQATTYLWNDIQAALASGKKSIFDPSPAGWKLPTITADSSAGTPWYGLTANLTSSVATFFTNAKYPANGLRVYNTGAMTNVGTTGYYWSASPSSLLV
ncbi:MAG: hypothetical protein SNI42_04670 [Rikenellaceae bacterium]